MQRARLVESRQGNPETAAQLFGTAFRLDPSGTGALTSLKRLHHAQGQWRELIHILEQEAELSPDLTDTEETTRLMTRLWTKFMTGQ